MSLLASAGRRFSPLFPLAVRARLDRRPYWALLLYGGRVVEEPDCDWLHAPRKGRLAVRLYCPDGQAPTLGNTVDATDRLFQFKVGLVALATGGEDDGPRRERRVEQRGASTVVWDTEAPPAPEAPRRRRRRATNGRRTLAHVIGMVRDLDGGCVLYAWEFDDAAPHGGRLVGPLLDNANRLAYHQVGKLSNEHLGLKAE